ncbi:Uncharacterized protein BCRIVMBC845_06459 [Bacillus cereus]|nr:Uncharacterized protein BCRIVMBC845_06459 [Bacillus cereus]
MIRLQHHKVLPKSGRQMIEHRDKLAERRYYLGERHFGRNHFAIMYEINRFRELTNAANWDVSLQLKHDAEQAAQRRKFLGGI